MTIRERLHLIIDEISDEQVESLLRQLVEKAESIKERKLSPELKSLFDFMDEVANNAPQEELDRMPIDFAENHDRYIYGRGDEKSFRRYFLSDRLSLPS